MHCIEVGIEISTLTNVIFNIISIQFMYAKEQTIEKEREKNRTNGKYREKK